MDFSKSDRTIWRLNGYLIFLAAAGVIVVSFIVGYKLIRDITRVRPTQNLVNIREGSQKVDRMRLGYLHRLTGTDFFLAPLNGEQNIRKAYYSKESASTRNYLLLNPKQETSTWIDSGNDALYLRHFEQFDRINDAKHHKVTALLFEAVDRDSNSDGLLDSDDAKKIILVTLNNKKITAPLTAMDRLIAVEQTSPTEILLVYEKGAGTFQAQLDITERKISKPRQIRPQ